MALAVPASAQSGTDSAMGTWKGTLLQPGGPYTQYNYTMNLTESPTGSVSGTTDINVIGNPALWGKISVTGTVSGSTLSFTEGSIISQSGGIEWCIKSGTLTFGPNGLTMSGNWTGTAGGGTCPPGSLSVANNGNNLLGNCLCVAGNVAVPLPINIATGNMWETADDYETAGPNKLGFMRYYNSFAATSTYAVELGGHWRHTYDRYLNVVSSSSVIAEEPDGQQLTFTLTGGVWVTNSDINTTLTQTGSGTGSTWTITKHDDTVETYTQLASGEGRLNTIKARNGYTQTMAYNGSGQLSSVTDSYSRALHFTYTTGGLLNTVTTPDGPTLTYSYNSSGINPGVNDRLASVSYSTSPATSKSYQYTDASYPFALTAIVDELGNTYASWTYDTYGRALTSQNAGGANLNTITYNDTNSNRVVTNALGVATTYQFSFPVSSGSPKVFEIDRAATTHTAAATEKFTYDANGYYASKTDWNGNVTTYVNNANGDPTTIVEASGTSVARTTTITYDTTWVHLPKTIVTPGLTTAYTYDSNGNVLTKVLTDTTTQTVPYSTNGQTRTWTYTWSNFLPHTVETPNSNTTTYTYDATGALTNTQNALSQNTQVTSHTAGGRPLTVIDPNGVKTTFTWSTRDWLLTSTVDTAAGNLTTTNTYDAAGNLTKVTQPDGSYLANTYDTAHRLTQVADSFGNSMNYTLDALGDRTASNIENPSGTVTRGHTATYDALGRKLTDVNGTNWTTSYTYDSNGNVKTYVPPSQTNTYTYDALNRRLTEVSTGTITTTYDAHDRPLTVTTRNGAKTSYVYDGFGDRIQEASPDRGTIVYHYDSDGNLTSKTDALSIVANHTYDALDRVLTNSYPADSAENVTYTYDQTGTGFAFGIGRLTSMSDAAGSLTRTYDERGNLITEKRINGSNSYTTTYGYDAASRVLTIDYPSGALVTYTRDAMGRITAVSDKPSGASSATTLASSVAYEPLGPWLGLTYGNAIAETVTYDGDYSLLTLKDIGTATVQSIAYAYATYDLPTTYTDSVSSANTVTATYNTLYYLDHQALTAGNWAINYDDNGNRTSYGTASYTYTADTNRLATMPITSYPTTTMTTNANGSITAFSPALPVFTTSAVSAGVMTGLNYNNAGELSSVSGSSGTLGTYLFDGFANRFSKNVGTATTVFQYSPNKVLLEESTGGTPTDYIYLNGRPLAMLTGTTFTYLHDDMIGTPKAATNASQTVVWRGNYTPFGPAISTSGTATVNLRYPGQYFDAETGLWHNGRRDYSTTLGRYIQSDPIGLAGGINTYAYVMNRPMDLSDPSGEANVSIIDPNDPYYFPTSRWNPPDQFTFAGHGNINDPNNIYTSDGNDPDMPPDPVSFQQVGNMILDKWDGMTDIYSLACYGNSSGFDGNLAQYLADKLGFPVTIYGQNGDVSITYQFSSGSSYSYSLFGMPMGPPVAPTFGGQINGPWYPQTRLPQQPTQ